MNAYECGNAHGFLCPQCKKGDNLYISATVTAHLTPEGVDTDNSDTEWDDDSRAWCGCSWEGFAGDLSSTSVPIDDEAPITDADRTFDLPPGVTPDLPEEDESKEEGLSNA